MKYEQKLELVPLWHRLGLTLEEATVYSGIGRDRLVRLADDPSCDFVLTIGHKRLFKRKKLDEFIDNAFSF